MATLAKQLQEPLDTRKYQFDAPGWMGAWSDLGDTCTRGGKQIEALLGQLRLAEFWLEHLIEDIGINTDTTVANINAVSPGNVRNLAKVSLETSLKTIRDAIAKGAE